MESSLGGISIESQNLIQQSMKEALLHMVESGKKHPKASKTDGEPPREYEKMIQKLEADIRGHIRLEHEMKIHMDYLEAKVEKFEKDQKSIDDQVQAHNLQLQALQDKLTLVKGDRDEKDKLLKKSRTMNEDLKKKLKDVETKNSQMTLKIE